METCDIVFPDLVLNNLQVQRKTGKYCDVRLTVGKRYIWTHSSVMCSLSPFINRECCYARKIPAIGNYKQFSYNAPLTIKLYKRDIFDCFKCLQMLADVIYGQKIEFDPVHSTHLYTLCKMLNLPDVLINLISNRVPKNGETQITSEQPENDFSKKVSNIDEIPATVKVETISSKRKIRSMRTRLSMSNLKALPNKTHSCISCPYKCIRPSDLLTHLRDTRHDGNVCSLCLSQFESNDKVREHYKMHDHLKPFFCSVCDLRFRTRCHLSQHLPRHSKETPYTCPLCKKGFKWKHGLNSHLVIHSNDQKFLCDECGFRTIHAKTMRAHKLTHTGDLFRCSFPGCSHTCSRKENMKIHLVTHNNDWPFVCEICGIKFTLNKSLKRHALIHSKVGFVNTCPHCPFTALRTDNLKAHILRQHVEKQTNELNDNQTSVKIEVEITDQRMLEYVFMDENNINDLSVLAEAASSLAKIQNITF